jgi:hypothetical protein
MNAYEKARDLIKKIEDHRAEIDSHQKMIGGLQAELQSALTEAGLKTGEGRHQLQFLPKGAGAPPAKAKTDVPSAAPVAVKRSHHKKVVAPPKPVLAASKPALASAGKPSKTKTTKAGSSRNGQKRDALTDKPTLGDLVRTVIIKAGRPLKRLEIQEGLQELNYSNSTRNPYKTLGVRLHRLQSRGVVSVGNSQFDVTAQWKRRHQRLIEAAEKKAAKEAAQAPAALATAASE